MDGRDGLCNVSHIFTFTSVRRSDILSAGTAGLAPPGILTIFTAYIRSTGSWTRKEISQPCTSHHRYSLANRGDCISRSYRGHQYIGGGRAWAHANHLNEIGSLEPASGAQSRLPSTTLYLAKSSPYREVSKAPAFFSAPQLSVVVHQHFPRLHVTGDGMQSYLLRPIHQLI